MSIQIIWQLVAMVVLYAQSMLAFVPLSTHRQGTLCSTTIRTRNFCPTRCADHHHHLKADDDLRLLVLVEPSPFTYVCGYSNRFQELFRYLQQRQQRGNRGHDDNVDTSRRTTSSTEVEIVTVEVVETNPRKIPHDRFGFPIHYTRGFRFWFYKRMSLSWDWTCQVLRRIWKFRPNLLHVTSPGFFVVPALCYARLFQIPAVFSYHTHIPVYIPSYLPSWLAPMVVPVIWWWIRFTHSLADLTLVTSKVIQEEFHMHGIQNVQVWQKGVDTDRFHPRHYSENMRRRMIFPDIPPVQKTVEIPEAIQKMTALPPAFAEGSSSSLTQHDDKREDPAAPLLLLYVGRLAAEKRIEKIKTVLEHTPNADLCIVGTGPHEDFLRHYFANTSTVFLGELHGTELSQAYASADIFVFPSDSETLGFVVLEAMASEIPVVAANAGGLPNIIMDDANTNATNINTGFLVDRDEDYTRFVRQLGEDKELRKRIASAGRRSAERWTWNASMAQLCDDHYKRAQRNFDQTWHVRWSRSLKRGIYKLRSLFGMVT